MEYHSHLYLTILQSWLFVAGIIIVVFEVFLFCALFVI
jgi:hypothetical protein